MPFIVIALLLAAALGGGTSLVAHNSLPGDALWGFKTEVLERLRSGDDIAVIQTRLQEAKALSAQGRLNAGAQADLVSNIEFHAAAVEKQIADNESVGNYAAAADLAARFQAMLAKEAGGVLDIRALLDSASELSAEASAKVKQ